MPFNIRVDVYHHDVDPPYIQTIAALTRTLKARNDQLAAAVRELSGQEEPRVRTSSTRSDTVSTPSMEQVIEQLRAEVERNSSVDDSAIQLIMNLADQIEQHQNNPAELQALVTTLREKTDALAASVVANTPADEGEGPQS
jgi:DNA repair exonuclease SbcCD ATPase subunit